jgi:hypothetical protein
MNIGFRVMQSISYVHSNVNFRYQYASTFFSLLFRVDAVFIVVVPLLKLLNILNFTRKGITNALVIAQIQRIREIFNIIFRVISTHILQDERES